MTQNQSGSEATTSVDQTSGGGATPAQVKRRSPRTFSSLQNNRDYRFLFTGTLSASAAHWLHTPKRALGGAAPIEYADTEPGVREIQDLIGRLEHGVFS